MATLALAEAGRAVLQVGRVVVQVAKGGGLKTMPLPLPTKIPTDNQIRVKAKNGSPKDCRRVLRFCDANGCVERTLSDPLLQERIIGSVVADFLTGDFFGRVPNTLQFICDEIYKCMQTELLNNTHRKIKTERYRKFSRRIGAWAKEGQGVEPLND